MTECRYETVARLLKSGMDMHQVAAEMDTSYAQVNALRTYAISRGVLTREPTTKPMYQVVADLYKDGLDSEQIAQKVGKHPGQVYRHLKNARDVGYLPKFKAKNPRVKGNVGSLKVEFHKLTPDIQKEWLSRAKGDDSIASVILDYAMDALYEEMAKK